MPPAILDLVSQNDSIFFSQLRYVFVGFRSLCSQRPLFEVGDFVLKAKADGEESCIDLELFSGNTFKRVAWPVSPSS